MEIFKVKIVAFILSWALFSVPAAAQKTCFCLALPGLDRPSFKGCYATRPGRATKDRVTCQTPDFLSSAVVPDADAYDRVDDGVGLCTPCEGVPPDEPGDDIRQPEPDGSDVEAEDE